MLPRLKSVLLATVILAPAALAQPILSVAPTQVSFLQSSSGQAPPSQTVSITSAGGGVPVNITGGASWLSHGLSSSSTPSILTLQVLASGLAEGTYTATLFVNGAGAANTPLPISVTLTVTGAPPTSVNPGQLSFFYATGGPLPEIQTFTLANTSSTFSIASNQTWLFVNTDFSGFVPVAQVSVDPTNLPSGTYTGLVTVAYNTTPATFQIVSVSLQVDANSTNLWSTSGPLVFDYKSGNPAPSAQTLSVSYASMIFFSAEASSTGNWLKIDTSSGITPATIQVSVDPTGLAIGTYSGIITLSSFSAIAPATVGVTLNVTGAPPLTAAPLSLDFQAAAGAAPPAGKSFTVSSLPSTNFQIRVAGGTWLTVSPATGTTPSTVTVTANPSGLAPGDYRASVIIQTPGATAGGQLVAISLTVTGSVSLRADPPDLIRFDTSGGGSVIPKAVSITSATPAQVALASSQPWLTVTPASGTTPLNVSVSAVTAGLAAGVYSGVITVSAPGAAQTIQIPVTLSIGGAASAIREVSNGAGLLRDFAPGSIMFIYGRDFGPRDMIVAPASRQYETILGGVSVLMGGVRAPLLSVSPTQILALVPFELSGRTQIDVQVQFQGVPSAPFPVSFAETAPILFTADGSGRGQAAAVNQNGSINSASARAPKGSIVSLYLTGGGLFDREVLTGAILEATGLRLRAPVRVFIGGLQADLQYAGQAPGMAAGILQFNVYVPLELTGGSAVPVATRIGDNFGQPGVTLAIE